MNNSTQSNPSRGTKWGWGILVAVCALLTLNGLALYFYLADTETIQTAAILETGVGALALAVSWEGFRRRPRWAWIATWVLVALLAAIGAHIMSSGDVGVGIWYFALTAVALAGQILARKGLIS